MAIGVVTGPGLLYAGVGPNNAFLFLGTAEEEIVPNFLPAWEPVKNALGGTRYGTDYNFEGEEATISAVLTRYNPAVLALAMRRTFRGGANGTAVAGSIGAFLGQEGLAFPICVVNPYATAKAINVANAVEPAYYFFACYSEGETIPSSPRARRTAVQFRAVRTFSLAAVGGYGLYSTTLPAGLPPIN